MAIGKITGSVVADNTLTESNLAFGVSGQSSASTWATDTLKVNIIESDDSTSVTVNDGLIVVGNFAFDGGASVNTILDEDTLASDSATALATQQSIKAYVDAETANIASDTLTFTNKTFDANGTGNSISNIEVADFAPASIINVAETLASNDSDTALVTAGAIIDYVDAQDANIASDTLTFTNKTFDANGTGNSLSNVDVADFASGVFLDEDNMASNSATAIASQQSIKAYVDSATSSIVTQIGISDSSSNSSTLTLGINDLEFRSGDSITATVAGTGVTFDLNETISVDTITAGDSTAVTFNSPIHVNTISSSDSTGININEAQLYVNGQAVLNTGSGGDVERTTNTANVTDVIINNSGTIFRIPLANIDISSFNNDAGYAAGGVSGFSTSTTTSFPVELGDSAARDYGDGEPDGLGTGTADNTDAFGVALGTTYDCMEPNGSLITADLGTDEAYVGA